MCPLCGLPLAELDADGAAMVNPNGCHPICYRGATRAATKDERDEQRRHLAGNAARAAREQRNAVKLAKLRGDVL